MLETNPSFRPVRVREGYPPLEDLGLIGDGATVALVGLDGSICWMCLPRFDSEPVFCGLLDRERGGHFTITPDELTEARQRYEPDTGVLVTELRSPTGLVRLTDALALRSGADLTDDVPGGRGELIRSAVVLDGSVRLRVELEPRGGAQTWMAASGLRLNPARRPDLQLHLRASQRHRQRRPLTTRTTSSKDSRTPRRARPTTTSRPSAGQGWTTSTRSSTRRPRPRTRPSPSPT